MGKRYGVNVVKKVSLVLASRGLSRRVSGLFAKEMPDVAISTVFRCNL